MTFNKTLVSSVSLISGGVKVEVQRRDGYEFVKGRPQITGQSSFFIRANIQPLTGNEILRLEEGDRTRDQLNLWTRTKLMKHDIVVYESRKYQVEIVEEWQSYFKARIVRMDVVVS